MSTVNEVDVLDPITYLPTSRPVQLLGETGELRSDPDFPLEVDDDDLLAMYRYMVLTRRVDQQGTALQRQGQLAVYASSLGQEATQVGSSYALETTDWVFVSYRELGCALVRGLQPEELFHTYRGTWLSHPGPYERRYGLHTNPIGTQTLHATGFAMAAKLDGADLVVATYFGDGATSEGDPHEAMNFAAVYQAPCVFFIQNNQYAISVPLSEQSRAPTLAHKAVGYGMPGYLCDGNDVLATYAVMRKAIARAREGGGPTLIEAVTYRMEGHTTADDPTRYRDEDELSEWRARDPIARFERFLRAGGLLDDESRDTVAAEANALADRVRTTMTDAPHRDPLEMFDHVYADPPRNVVQQRELLRRELAAGTSDGGRS